MEQFPPVRTKANFVERFIAGEFGNRTPVWGTIGEMSKQADIYGTYGLRNRHRPGSGWFQYLDYFEALRTWDSQPIISHWYGSQMLPHEDHTLINAEVMRTASGLYLYYSTVKEPMRPSLAKGGKHVWGLESHLILRRNLCPNSLSWLELLLDRYPEHVVELTSLDVCRGVLPNYNAIFWEVRLY